MKLDELMEDVMNLDELVEDVMNLDINKESMDDNRGHSQD